MVVVYYPLEKRHFLKKVFFDFGGSSLPPTQKKLFFKKGLLPISGVVVNYPPFAPRIEKRVLIKPIISIFGPVVNFYP